LDFLKLRITLFLSKLNNMKNLFLFLLIAFFISCDDGDKIVTDFDFDEDSDLKMCKVRSNNVLYVVNTNPDEAIALNFSNDNFDGTFIEDDISQTLLIEIGGNNQLVYRTFNESLDGGTGYFCSGIPPTSPKVLQEYYSKDGGYVELVTYLIDQEVDEAENTVTRVFETYATAHDITLKNIAKEEEIVEETLNMGFMTKTETYDLEDLQ